MRIPETLYSTFANKCPRCHQGKVFANRNPYNIRETLHMKSDCDHCGLHYEREPGFFYGAMYVSYAITAIILFIWLVSDLLWLHQEPEVLFGWVVLTVLLTFSLIFRWARIIWLNFFIRFDKLKYGSKSEMIHS